ncbi:NAD(P)-dependent oxidoreductase [Nocardiopsis aegyptia]|uniref:NAD(P)-dependent oxidoreductase n=1 Tax=Nocardiopsis aegyptia TaxID=220378 RepID=UPI00366A9857
MDGRREHGEADGGRRTRVCVVGASGKLGRHMVRHALERDYEVVGVCREQSVGKLAEFADRVTVVPGPTDDREVIARAVEGCDAVLTVLVPWGVRGYSTGTAQAVLDLAPRGARLVFSCGWHVPRDEHDVYSLWSRVIMRVVTVLARLARVIDVDDQVRACRRIYADDTRWTVVRGSDLEEGASQGLPIWRRHVGDPALASNITRRTDFALFMVEAITDDDLIHEAPAIVGRHTPSALGVTGSSARPAG